MTPTREAIKGCAEWLAACLKLGWRRDALDLLEELWWKYHDERGNLKPPSHNVDPLLLEDAQQKTE